MRIADSVVLNSPVLLSLTAALRCIRPACICWYERALPACGLQRQWLTLPPAGAVQVGFTDKLRFMNILMDDIRFVKEFPLKCPEVRFSNGGQYFAAAHAGYVHHV